MQSSAGTQLEVGTRVSFPAAKWTGWERRTGTVDIAEPDARGFVRVRYDEAYPSLAWHDPATLIVDGPRVWAGR